MIQRCPKTITCAHDSKELNTIEAAQSQDIIGGPMAIKSTTIRPFADCEQV